MSKITMNGSVFEVKPGTLLSDFLHFSNNDIAHPCGGKGTCKKCIVQVNGKEELSCQYVVSSDIEVQLPDDEEIYSEIGAVESNKETAHMCFALDIGTTTLVLALVSLDDKRIINTITRTNPQKRIGADIMTRIEYCREHGVHELQHLLLSEINQMISEFHIHHSIDLFLSGNTTMLHLFWGIDCSSMGIAPYTPSFLCEMKGYGADLAIANINQILSLPSISSFVGADIVAGLHYIGLPKQGKYNLLVDLGTNAEIVLYSSSTAICSAAAAGPCFEGANISCGMNATRGAIYSYDNGISQTINDAPPKGICGTGLIDIIADLLQKEIIDETGYMEDDPFQIAPGIFLTQGDVRQYQLAKSAIHSAIETLIRMEKITFEDIDTLYISGGFSSKVNIQNAIRSGLFPCEVVSKCVPIKNSSLLGTVKYACKSQSISPVFLQASYIDLATSTIFSELFIRHMLFES